MPPRLGRCAISPRIWPGAPRRSSPSSPASLATTSPASTRYARTPACRPSWPCPPRAAEPRVTEPDRTPPDEVHVANRATYWPVAPIDLLIVAPLAARLLLGATPAGRVVKAVALGLYAASALRDWRDRRGIRRISFRRELGADGRHLVPMPQELREAEVS